MSMASNFWQTFVFCEIESNQKCGEILGGSKTPVVDTDVPCHMRHGTYRKHFESIKQNGLLAGGGQGSGCCKCWHLASHPTCHTYNEKTIETKKWTSLKFPVLEPELQ